MMPMAKKTGRCTSCAASRIFCDRRAGVVLLGEMADDVLDHDHRAIDHHAEVQSAQRKQVGGNVAEVEADGGEQQREGNGEGDDDGAAHVAEEEKENDGDEDHALGQVVLDGFDGVLDQIGAVEEGNDFHALGQNAVVEFVDFLVNALQGRDRSRRPFAAGRCLRRCRDCRRWCRRGGEWLCRSGRGGSLGPWVTVAMSLILMAAPLEFLMTVFSMSWTLVKRPTDCTLICCAPCSMKLPPPLVLLLAICCSTWAMRQAVGDQLLRVEPDLVFLGGPAEAGYVDHALDALERLLQ